jgi:hypothetical protein
VKFEQLNSMIKIGFEPQKLNIYGKQQGTLFLTTKEIHVTPLEDKLSTYRHSWFQHVHRMEDKRLPKNF